MNKNLAKLSFLHVSLNPDVFLYAAEQIFQETGEGDSGACKAIAFANRVLEDNSGGYSSLYHKFFNFHFPWWNSDDADLQSGENVISFGPYLRNWDGPYYEKQEAKEHRIQALLLCYELCQLNNKRILKNERRRSKNKS